MYKRLIILFIQFLTFSIVALGISGNAIAFDPFGGSVCNQTDASGNRSAVCEANGSKDPITGPDGVITKIADIFALITGVAAVVAIIVGGFEYVRSGGESAKVNKAKNTIMFAVIGLVVVVAARSLVVLAVSKL